MEPVTCLTVGSFLGLMVPLVAESLTLPGPVPQPEAMRVLLHGFESDDDLGRVELVDCAGERHREQATQGQWALAVRHRPGSVLRFRRDAGGFVVADWRPYRKFIVEVYNPGDVSLYLLLRFRDGAGRVATRSYFVLAGAVTQVQSHISYPDSWDHFDTEIDVSNVAEFEVIPQLEGGPGKPPLDAATLCYDNLRLETAVFRWVEVGAWEVGENELVLKVRNARVEDGVFRLRTRVYPLSGNVAEGEFTPPVRIRAGREAEVSVPYLLPEPGRHVVEVEAVCQGAEEPYFTRSFVAEAPRPAAAIRPGRITFRDDKITLIDGQPFFPLGVFGAPNQPDFFARLRELGGNWVHSYAQGDGLAFTQQVAAYGLWAMPQDVLPLVREGNREAIRARHEAFRPLPHFFGWYLDDDTPFHGVGPEDLRPVTEASTDHPTLLHNPLPGCHDGYADAVDVILLPYRGDYHDGFHLSPTRRAFAYSMTSLSSGGANVFYDSYHAVINGAVGFLYFLCGNQHPYNVTEHKCEVWLQAENALRQLACLQPVLTARTSPARLRCDPADSGLDTLVKERDGHLFLLAINTHETETQTATLTHPGLPPSLENGETEGAVKVLFEGRTVPVRDGAFRDEFAPHQVHVYTTDLEFDDRVEFARSIREGVTYTASEPGTLDPNAPAPAEAILVDGTGNYGLSWGLETGGGPVDLTFDLGRPQTVEEVSLIFRVSQDRYAFPGATLAGRREEEPDWVPLATFRPATSEVEWPDLGLNVALFDEIAVTTPDGPVALENAGLDEAPAAGLFHTTTASGGGGVAGATLETERTAVHGGAGAVRIVNPGHRGQDQAGDETGEIATLRSPRFPVTPGMDYTVSVWVRVERGSASTVGLGMRWERPEGGYLGRVPTVCAGRVGEWRQLTTGGLAPEGAATARLELFVDTRSGYHRVRDATRQRLPLPHRGPWRWLRLQFPSWERGVLYLTEVQMVTAGRS